MELGTPASLSVLTAENVFNIYLTVTKAITSKRGANSDGLVDDVHCDIERALKINPIFNTSWCQNDHHQSKNYTSFTINYSASR
jgi:hypothetical protein